MLLRLYALWSRFMTLADADSFFDLSESLIILPVTYFCPLTIDGIVLPSDAFLSRTSPKNVFVYIQIMSAALTAYPVSILRKYISGRHRPVRVADGPMTARCRFT